MGANRPRRRPADRALRSPMRSPGRPPVGRREHRQRFWEEVARGLSSEEAAVAAGVSPAVGTRWFRQCGGMPPFNLRPVSGRYLSFVEREEIAVLQAAVAACARSPGSWGAHRRRSQENCAGTQPHEAESSGIGLRPPNGTPIDERNVRKLPNSPRTVNCGSMCRNASGA